MVLVRCGNKVMSINQSNKYGTHLGESQDNNGSNLYHNSIKTIYDMPRNNKKVMIICYSDTC